MAIRRSLVRVLVGFALVLVAGSVRAGSITGTLVFTPGCADIAVSGGGTLNYTRDNTGTGQENVVLEATDGAGVVVFLGNDPRTVGTTGVTFAPSYAYATLPTMNPISVRLFSPAGNGLAEETLATGFGICAGLSSNIPVLDARGLVALSLALAVAAVFAIRRSGV